MDGGSGDSVGNKALCQRYTVKPNARKDEGKVKQVFAKMKVTMMTDDQLQTMKAKIQEGGDTMPSD